MQYTIKQFSEKSDLSQEYLRQACRGYVDKNGKKAKLPHGFKAKKIFDSWIIEEEKWHLPYMSFPVNGLPFDETFTKSLDLKVISDARLSKPVYLLNLFDYYGPLMKEPGLYMDISADYILYLVYRFLEQKNLRHSNKFKEAIRQSDSIFVDNIDLLASWLFESGKPLYFNKHVYSKPLTHCLWCGQELVNKNAQKYIFCNDTHFSDFYKRKTSVFLLLAKIQPLSKFDHDYAFSGGSSELVYSEIEVLHAEYIKVAKRMVQILTAVKLPVAEGINQDSIYKQLYELMSEKKHIIVDELSDRVDNSNPVTKEKYIRELIEEHVVSKLRLHQREVIKGSSIYRQFIYKLFQSG